MRVFQNSGLYPAYRARFDAMAAGAPTFDARRRTFLADRYGASHYLRPVLDGAENAFVTNGDDEVLQRLWARDRGLPADTALEEILLAQMEEHRAEVFYNLDPVRFGSAFVKRLPGSVRRRVCWRAAPASLDLSGYDVVVNNFPALLERYRAEGLRAEPFSPAFDPVCAPIAASEDRPIDVLFIGGYTRHHRRRAAVLEAVAGLAGRYRVEFCLDGSRLTRLAESPLGLVPPLSRHRRPRGVRRISHAPVFGLDMYRRLARSKIVLNGAIDMAGEDRGNIRCFEAWALRCALVSDRGRYPPAFVEGTNLVTYDSPAEAVARIEELLADPARLLRLRDAGHATITTRYSKAAQWDRFAEICA